MQETQGCASSRVPGGLAVVFVAISLPLSHSLSCPASPRKLLTKLPHVALCIKVCFQANPANISRYDEHITADEYTHAHTCVGDRHAYRRVLYPPSLGAQSDVRIFGPATTQKSKLLPAPAGSLSWDDDCDTFASPCSAKQRKEHTQVLTTHAAGHHAYLQPFANNKSKMSTSAILRGPITCILFFDHRLHP